MVKKISRKKEIDPNAPRKPASSYFFFLQVRRNKLKQERPELTHNESVIYLGKEWDMLNKVQKLVFERLSEADKIRYERECAEYLEKNPHLKDQDSESSNSINVSEKKEVVKKKKPTIENLKTVRDKKKKSIKSKTNNDTNKNKNDKKPKSNKNNSKKTNNEIKNDNIEEKNVSINDNNNDMKIDSTIHMNLLIESTDKEGNNINKEDDKLSDFEDKNQINSSSNNLNETIII